MPELLKSSHLNQLSGEALLGIIPLSSPSFDIYAVADGMHKRGWFTARTSDPTAMHMVVTPQHFHTVNAFLVDLAEAVAEVKSGKSSDANFNPDC